MKKQSKSGKRSVASSRTEYISTKCKRSGPPLTETHNGGKPATQIPGQPVKPDADTPWRWIEVGRAIWNTKDEILFIREGWDGEGHLGLCLHADGKSEFVTVPEALNWYRETFIVGKPGQVGSDYGDGGVRFFKMIEGVFEASETESFQVTLSDDCRTRQLRLRVTEGNYKALQLCATRYNESLEEYLRSQLDNGMECDLGEIRHELKEEMLEEKQEPSRKGGAR